MVVTCAIPSGRGRSDPPSLPCVMAPILFRNLQLLDPRWDEPRGGYEVLVEGDTIREVSDGPIASESADVVDCGGGTLMPGLIDCHAHVTLTSMTIADLEAMPVTLMTARAGESLRAMLDRGFTTVRDTGGADWGIQKAVADGHFAGPRLRHGDILAPFQHLRPAMAGQINA